MVGSGKQLSWLLETSGGLESQWQDDKNSILCTDYKKDFSKRSSKIFLE